MSISLSRYINISSGVGGASTVGNRDLGGLIVTTSTLCPAGKVISFTNATAVAKFFGTTSNEAFAASEYFGFTSKTAGKPRKLSFVLHAEAAQPATVFGSAVSDAIADYQKITNGKLTITLGADTADVTVDLSTATDIPGVATKLQTAIAAEITGVTVSWQAATKTFKIVAPAAVTSGSFVIGSDGDEATFGLDVDNGAISAPATPAQTPLDALISAVDSTDDFGSVMFLHSILGPDEIAVCAWIHAQNIKFMFSTDYTSKVQRAALASYSGVSVGYCDYIGSDAEKAKERIKVLLAPMAILASIDWTRRAAGQQPMYTRFDSVRALVKDDALATELDAMRVNYVGTVQQAGKEVSFYQRGMLQGDNTAPVDMLTFFGEQWLKDDALVELLNAFLALPTVPATDTGRGIMFNAMQSTISQALDNNTIIAGKTLTATQKAYLLQLTNDELSAQTLTTKGYILDVQIQDYIGPSGVQEYKAVYQLIYSKADSIRKVDGFDILI